MIAPHSTAESFLSKRATVDEAGGLVSKPQTAGYMPSVVWNSWELWRRTPPFHIRRVPWMLVDPRIQFGLYLLKGPIATKAKIFVKCDHPAAKEFIVKTICRFWQNSLMQALRAVEWGYSCSEPLYRMTPDGEMNFHILKNVYALDTTAIKNQDGLVTGARVGSIPGRSPVILRGKHLFWHVHGREHQPILGLSRLFPCWKTFLEKWDSGGYRDIRRLFYYKCAFSTGTIWYPPENLPNSTQSSQDYANQLQQLARTGAGFTFPNIKDPAGNDKWRYDPPTSVPPPPGMQEYGDHLDDELWEGMGIPPEIARAEGTGAYAGRLIPQQAFLSNISELLNFLLADLKDQILIPLCIFNFGPVEFDLQPYSMLQQEDDEDNGGNASLLQTQQQSQQNPQGSAMSHAFSGRETNTTLVEPITGKRWNYPST